MKKHIVTLFAILALCVTFCIAAPKADATTSGDYTYIVSDGKATITDFSIFVSGSITIPSTLGGYPVTTIGNWAFDGCHNLTSVTIPDSVTTIGSYAFSGCYGLKSVTIGNSVTTIGSYAFEYCSGLKSVTIGNSVTTIREDAFKNCIDLTGVYISDMAAWCAIDFYDYVSNPLYDAEKLYLNGELVTTLEIPDSVTTIGNYAFYNCTGLTSVTIPDSVTTIGEDAFYECTGLTSVTIGNSVTTIDKYAFYKCTGLTSVTIGNSVTTIDKYAFYKCTGLTSVTIGNSVTTIGNYVFEYCTGLKSVTIPDSVTTIGDWAFSYCTGLTSVTIPDSMTTIGRYVFAYCYSLTTVTIPDSVTTIGSLAFAYCTSLTSVTIPDSVTTIGNSAFADTAWYKNQPDGLVYAGKMAYKYKGTCPATVTIQEGTLGIADYAFDDCDGLTSVTIPDSVTTIGNYAFSDCTGLTTVTIPDSVTTIGNYAFYSCDGLTSVTIPDSVTTIGNYAFYSCDGLTSVTIGNSVTTIGEWAFYYCTGLTSVTIPDSVTTIGRNAFLACTGLTHVAYTGTQSQWSAISIGQYNEELTGATRHYEISFQYIDNCVELSVYCPVCEQFIVKTVKAGGAHSWEAATCTTPNTCTVCGVTEGDALGHAGQWFNLVPATCTNDGVEARVCTACGETESRGIPATGHNYTVSVVEPTCTKQGYSTYSCACGDSYAVDYVDATGHSGSWMELAPASCTDDGVLARICLICGTTETQAIPATGHSNSEVVVAPTCTEQGSITKTCSVCGNVDIEVVAAKGHSWSAWVTITKATCTKEGSQMRFCNCGTRETEAIPVIAHSYTDGTCSVCGAAEVVEIEKFDIDVARMILGNALEFQFGVAMTKIPDTTGYYALIEKEWADGTTTTKTIPAAEWGVAGQYWAVVYDGLAAKEMGDTFFVTIYNAKGEAVSNPKQDSVRDYVSRAFASQKEAGKTMMVDMLNYGAAAQVYTNYGTADLANNKLTDAQKATGTSATPVMENKLVKGTNYSGSRFILTSRIQVQLAFKNLTADMYAIYTYTSAKGEAKTVRVEGSDFVIIGGKPAGVELSQLVYADARTMVKVTVYKADGTVHGTATDSIESCCVRSGGDLFVNLMKFADSAKKALFG